MVDAVTGMLTIREVAKKLDRSIEQVRRYVREGKLPAQKIGMQWFVAPDDLSGFSTGGAGRGAEMAKWLEEVMKFQEHLRGSGAVLSNEESVSVLHEIREERDREILSGWDPRREQMS